MLTYDQRKSKAKETAAKWVHLSNMYAVGMEAGFDEGARWAEDIYIKEIYRLRAELEAKKRSKKRK